MLKLTWDQAWAYRLARHSLRTPAPADRLVEVGGAVCGIHAQVMVAAELSLGIRVAGITQRDVRAALWEQRRLVKTYGIRGTVHLFPADELPLWMAAGRTRAAEDAEHLARLGLSAEQVAAILPAMRDALDGRRLTLAELGAAVVERVGAWADETSVPVWGGTWPRWRIALGAAAATGVLCFGPNQGTAVTFVRPDQWFGSWQDLDPRASVLEVFRRYLHAYGPAAPRDFAQWYAVPLPVARDLAATLESEVEEVDVEGYRALLLAVDAADLPQPEGESVHLLPHFDCYVIGCHPRERLLSSAWTTRVPPRTTPSQLPNLLVDGVVAGLWERQARGKRVAVRVEPLAPLTARQEELLAAAARRVGEILEGEATLNVGSVSVRPHL